MVVPSLLHGFVPATAAWGLPFAGLLLSIAIIPALFPVAWPRLMPGVTLAWCLALLLPEAWLAGPGPAAAAAWHALLLDYLPLLSLLLALYVAGGGILLQGGPSGTPAGNTVLLAAAVAMAALLGTTAAAMVMIRPLLRANEHRRQRVHLVVFAILLVANAGGGFLPLGPPLYIGFLHGVDFLWPWRHLCLPILTVVLPLLAAFFAIDRHLAGGEPAPPPRQKLRLQGGVNLLLAGVVAASVLGQGLLGQGLLGQSLLSQSRVAGGLIGGAQVTLLGQAMPMLRLAGIGCCLLATAVSLAVTPRALRDANDFHWGPIGEVALLFAGLFITIAPVIALLSQGAAGPLAPLLLATRDAAGKPVPLVYFWLTGLLSGFLDNAPTYLVFFQQAGGDARALAAPPARTLVAISAGSVLFGGLSYIGNAPNLMLAAIATRQGVRMPGFFTYTAIAALLLFPCFLLLSLLFLW